MDIEHHDQAGGEELCEDRRLGAADGDPTPSASHPGSGADQHLQGRRARGQRPAAVPACIPWSRASWNVAATTPAGARIWMVVTRSRCEVEDSTAARDGPDPRCVIVRPCVAFSTPSWASTRGRSLPSSCPRRTSTKSRLYSNYARPNPAEDQWSWRAWPDGGEPFDGPMGTT